MTLATTYTGPAQGDAEGLVLLDRTPEPGFLAMLRRRGFRAIKQKGGYLDRSRLYVEDFALVLVEHVEPPLTVAALTAALDVCKADPDFRASLATVSALCPESGQPWDELKGGGTVRGRAVTTLLRSRVPLVEVGKWKRLDLDPSRQAAEPVARP